MDKHQRSEFADLPIGVVTTGEMRARIRELETEKQRLITALALKDEALRKAQDAVGTQRAWVEDYKSQRDRLADENERLRLAYARLVERLRLATPKSLMAVTEEDLT